MCPLCPAPAPRDPGTLDSLEQVLPIPQQLVAVHLLCAEAKGRHEGCGEAPRRKTEVGDTLNREQSQEEAGDSCRKGPLWQRKPPRGPDLDMGERGTPQGHGDVENCLTGHCFWSQN